jgi:hypothetical protein
MPQGIHSSYNLTIENLNFKMNTEISSVIEFRHRKKMFALRGLLPMLILMFLACVLMSWALPNHSDLFIVLANALLFISGMLFVIMAKRYYRCPACEKVVVPTKEDGTPSDVSFSIAYKPKVCPYCSVPLR